ncbi:hypothetical protein KY338_06745 [Candidatus Woesearchaeota archaeon]|nr:hypothetical protein [Candidatus Woesearchaeota archaeon]MBW3005578.1 hypothetical protein [Candidatus Woesearchaeota archaeon]
MAEQHIVNMVTITELWRMVEDPRISDWTKARNITRHNCVATIFALDNLDSIQYLSDCGFDRTGQELMIPHTARCTMFHFRDTRMPSTFEYELAVNDIKTLYGLISKRKICVIDFSHHKNTRDQRYEIADEFADLARQVRFPDHLPAEEKVAAWLSDANEECIMNIIKGSADDYDLALHNLKEFKKINNIRR